MKATLHIATSLRRFHWPGTTLFIQAPLPNLLHTLPILLTFEGQGSGRQGPPPLAPSRETTNDKSHSLRQDHS